MQRLCIAIILSLVIPTATLGETAPHISKNPVSYQQLNAAAKQEVDCLADNIYFESAGEPRKGQKAVAMVTVNRLKTNDFGTTICSVVKQKIDNKCQFSWWCNSRLRYMALNKKYDKQTYERIRQIAVDIYLNHGKMRDVTDGATFFHATRVPKRSLGVKNLQMTVQIGQHIFYRT